MKSEIAQQGKDDEENKGGESVESRLRSSQHSALSKRFVDVMGQYQDVQTRCKARFKQRMERQYLIGELDIEMACTLSFLTGICSQFNLRPRHSRWKRPLRTTRAQSSHSSSWPPIRGLRPRRHSRTSRTATPRS